MNEKREDNGNDDYTDEQWGHNEETRRAETEQIQVELDWIGGKGGGTGGRDGSGEGGGKPRPPPFAGGAGSASGMDGPDMSTVERL